VYEKALFKHKTLYMMDPEEGHLFELGPVDCDARADGVTFVNKKQKKKISGTMAHHRYRTFGKKTADDMLNPAERMNFHTNRGQRLSAWLSTAQGHLPGRVFDNSQSRAR